MTLQEYTTKAVKLNLELDKLNRECLKHFDRYPILTSVPYEQAKQQLDTEAIKLPNDIKATLYKHRNKTQDTVIIPTKLLINRYSHELKLHRINNHQVIREITEQLKGTQCNTQGHRVEAELVNPHIVVM